MKNASNSFNERHFFISLFLINISSFSTLKDSFSSDAMQRAFSREHYGNGEDALRHEIHKKNLCDSSDTLIIL
jgi:hypothetical protein